MLAGSGLGILSWLRFINYSLFIFCPFLFAVEGVVASLSTARNCIALGSRAVKQHAQRRIQHARLLKDG